MKKLFYILLFVGSFLFYWSSVTAIENRTEAEDVFEYASMVEQGGEHAWFFHQHHLLYGPFMRGCYLAVQSVGYTGRAIDIMRLISALAASGTLYFFFLFCYKRFSLRPISSLLATVFLGITYGFWRYSAESEIPLIASFPMVIALYFSTDPEKRKRAVVLTIFFSTFSVLLHIMNAVAVFVAIPCLYILRKRWRIAIFHLILCGGLILFIYYVVNQIGTIHRSGGGRLSMIGLGSFVKGIVAFLQCIISCDFMMGFVSVRAFLAELFAGRMLLEEFYYGVRLSRGYVLFSVLTFVGFISCALVCLFRAGWIWKNRVSAQLKFQLPEGLSALVVAAIFFFGYAGLLLFIEPGNPELWVMGLIPFCLLLCGGVLLPLTFDNRLWLPLLMVIFLLIHNGEAIRQLQDVDKDYQQQKSAEILKLTGSEDLIITAGNPVFEQYLRYHSAAEVLYLYDLTEEQLVTGFALECAGQIFILGDVFNQPRSLKIRFPEKTMEIEQFAERIKSYSEKVVDDPFGGVYRFEKYPMESGN
jgi:hypothetical protein